MFNKAIMKGPLNEDKRGRDMSLAVANRSAALLRLGHLEAALEDVDLALASGYPKDLRYKLYDRKLILMETLAITDGVEETQQAFAEALDASTLTKEKKLKLLDEFKKCRRLETESKKLTQDLECQKLLHPRSDLPCLTSKVDVRYEESRGRFVVANTYIATGSVVLAEEAAVSCGREAESWRRCDRCLAQLSLQPAACFSCAEVAFCGAACRDLALGNLANTLKYLICIYSIIDGYHKYECGMANSFKTILSSMPEDKRGNVEDLVDITRVALRASI